MKKWRDWDIFIFMNESELKNFIKKVLLENELIHEEDLNEFSGVPAIVGATTPIGTPSTYPNSSTKPSRNKELKIQVRRKAKANQRLEKKRRSKLGGKVWKFKEF